LHSVARSRPVTHPNFLKF